MSESTTVESTRVTTPVEQRSFLMGGAKDLSAARNVEEALKLAGLDWEPKLAEINARYNGSDVAIPDHKAVVRSDTGKSMGVVGKKFEPITNRELGEFGQALVDEADLNWEIGGELSGGKMTYLQFKLPDSVMIAGQDQVDTWVMLTTGHVGNSSLTSSLIPYRIGCGNQVRSSRLKYANHKIRHSGNIEEKIAEAREVLQLSTKYMVEFENIANRLADIDVDVTFFEDFVDELLPISPEDGVRSVNTTNRQRAQIRRNWKDTTTIDPDLLHTGWGALNVVTEVIDHGNLRVRKSSKDAGERRFREVFMGSGAKLRDRAFDLLATELEEPGKLHDRAVKQRQLLTVN